MTATRHRLPETGRDWPTLRRQLEQMGEGDADWRRGRTAVYVFNAGDDVLDVAKQAYALYQSENGLGGGAFPSLRAMESQVIDMGLGLLNAPPDACGNLTSGGTESILMAVKACRDQAAAGGSLGAKANLVVPESAHLAFDKACHYLGLEIIRVPVGPDLRADPIAMAGATNAATIMLAASAPCFPYGLIDPIEPLAKLALERGLWLHVDACVGGYFAPFARMNGVAVEPFDFAVEGVASISADLHKYGYTAKGASTIFHRSEVQRSYQIFQSDAWPAGSMTTPTAAGTRPGGAIASAWAVMHYLGEAGYREKARIVCETRARLEAAISALPGFETVGEPKLGIFLYGSSELDIFKVYGALLSRGWVTGVVTQPPAIHMMLSPSHASFMDEYLADLEAVASDIRAGKDPSQAPEARYA